MDNVLGKKHTCSDIFRTIMEDVKKCQEADLTNRAVAVIWPVFPVWSLLALSYTVGGYDVAWECRNWKNGLSNTLLQERVLWSLQVLLKPTALTALHVVLWLYKENKTSKVISRHIGLFLLNYSEITRGLDNEKWVLMTQPPSAKVVTIRGNNTCC